MAEIILPTKPLAVNPLKACQPIGASLAFLGLKGSLPLEHGARGCTSFNKLFFMRHFREPIALQTTAMDQLTTVLGADDTVVEALSTICDRNRPQVIGLITTGLSAIQGADIPRTIAAFRTARPDLADVHVISVAATDTLGCLESGFALALEAIIAAFVPSAPAKIRRPRQVNVLASAMLTPGDVEEIKAWAEAFGLVPIVVPDIADSLDGHLIEDGFSPLTYGGTPVEAIAAMSESIATLVVGNSIERAANLLKTRTGVPDFRFPGLMGLEVCDAFTATLAAIANTQVPRTVERRRAQLTDAMVDCQFQLGGARLALAADPDLLASLVTFLAGMGLDIVGAVASNRALHLAELPVDAVVIGDLEDLEWLARERATDLLITNSHGLEIARRVGTALLRAGFPIYDTYGAHAEAWVGYGGSRRTLFQLSNLLATHYQDLQPYHARLRQGARSRASEGEQSCCG